MAYQTNIAAFLSTGSNHPLLDAYRILVAIELALKDAGCNRQGGHDIPSMLAQTASKHPTLASQLNAHLAKLRNDLTQLVCNGPHGSPTQVPARNYPYARYTRFAGDWAGIDETPSQQVIALAQTCNSLLLHLQTHKVTLGIQL